MIRSAKRFLTALLLAVASFCVCFCNSVFAREPEEILADVRQALGEDLTPLDLALPGYIRPAGQAPSLAIGQLETQTDDGLNWERAISSALRRQVMYTPGCLLTMPLPSLMDDDCKSSSIPKALQAKSLSSLILLHERLGIENLITGDLTISQGRFNLTLKLHRAPFSGHITILPYAGDLTDLPQSLTQTVLDIYATLGVELQGYFREYATKNTPEIFSELRELAELYHSYDLRPSEEHFKKLVTEKWRRGTKLPTIAAHMINVTGDIRSLAEHNQALQEIIDRFPTNAGVAHLVASAMRYNGNDEHFNLKWQRFIQLIRDNPQDPNPFVALADIYNQTRRSDSGAAVALEGLTRWPHNYRLWWALAESLENRAWSYRGPEFWDKVPQKGRELYPLLMKLANEAIDRALAVQQELPALWHRKMKVNPGYSEAMMTWFYKVIELDPKYRLAYETALHFSLPQWGGDRMIREKIFRLAEENDPDGEWATSLRSKFTIDWQKWAETIGVEETRRFQMLDGVPETDWLKEPSRSLELLRNINPTILLAIGGVLAGLAIIFAGWHYGRRY